MEIKRVGSQASGKGPAEYFTGTVALIRCLKRMLRLARLAQVSPSSRVLGQRGTRIRLAKRSS